MDNAQPAQSKNANPENRVSPRAAMIQLEKDIKMMKVEYDTLKIKTMTN